MLLPTSGKKHYLTTLTTDAKETKDWAVNSKIIQTLCVEEKRDLNFFAESKEGVCNLRWWPGRGASSQVQMCKTDTSSFFYFLVSK